MSTTYSDPVLTQDELAFISEMDFTQKTMPDSVDLKLDLEDDGRINVLLERLGLATELKLVAQYHNQQLVFPVGIGQDEFGKFSMELRSPEIFEAGEQLRNWRYKLETPMLGTCRLANKQFILNELSSTGFCLDISYLDAPERLQLDVRLPETQTHLEFNAQKVRQTNNKQTAYSIELDDAERDILRRYLFKQHREQFQQKEASPELIESLIA